MKKITLIELSLLCFFNGAYCSNEIKPTITFDDEIKVHAQQYLGLIHIPDTNTQLKNELREFLQERYENAQMCFAADKYINAYTCETTYNNQYIFMDTSVIEADFKDRIVYFYEKIVNECFDGALLQEFNRCKTWREWNTLQFTIKRNFAQAVLNALTQQDQESK